jgi:hypothetical protein
MLQTDSYWPPSQPTSKTLWNKLVQSLGDDLHPEREIMIELDWQPFEGSPQEKAYHSEADVIGFGGAAGGGKSDLILGKAFTQFQRSAIYRLNNGDLQDLIERGDEILDGMATFVRGEKRRWDLPDGRMVMAQSAERVSDIRKYRGRARDFIAFDEAAEFPELVVRTLMGWLRTTTEGQRTQVLLTFNPPGEDGEWLIEYFGPWLNPDHPNPADDGELRWYHREDDQDVPADGPDDVRLVENGDQTIEVKPTSRTFFHARVQDNPALMRTEYPGQLNSLPEPTRSQLLFGDMSIGKKDDSWQVIPTAWILEAERRWREGSRPELRCRAVGVDPSRGGDDEFGVALLFGNWFEVHGFPGKSAPDGRAGAHLVESVLVDKCPMWVDTIGYGASVYDVLKQTHEAYAVNVGSKSTKTDQSKMYEFNNLRSETWWKFREALDPANGHEIALPPIRNLRSDLRAPRYRRVGRNIVVESKQDIKKRINRSTDYADAVLLAWYGVNNQIRIEVARYA